MSVLSVRNVTAGYAGRAVIEEVDLDVAGGEILLLIGSNGCGKSTLLKVVSGVLRQTQGELALSGEDISKFPIQRRVFRGLGYLMQTRNIFPSLSMHENLRLAAWNSRAGFAQRKEQVLSFFPALRDAGDRRAGLLSGGQRQALAIAMVMMHDRKILLLDEPTAGLSPKAAQTILDNIKEMQAGTGVAILIVEHNIRLVRDWVDRVTVMNHGRIVAGSREVRDFLAHETLQEYYF